MLRTPEIREAAIAAFREATQQQGNEDVRDDMAQWVNLLQYGFVMGPENAMVVDIPIYEDGEVICHAVIMFQGASSVILPDNMERGPVITTELKMYDEEQEQWVPYERQR